MGRLSPPTSSALQLCPLFCSKPEATLLAWALISSSVHLGSGKASTLYLCL